MQIAKHTVVAIEYSLTTDEGEVLDTSSGRGPLAYLHGVGGIVPGLEEELEGKEQGDAFKVRLEPDKAYGERDENMVQTVPRGELPPGELAVGMQLQAQNEQGTFLLTIVEVGEEQVRLDGNHPLAGVPLNFEVTVGEVRAATSEEIEHGHPHGPEGHEH